MKNRIILSLFIGLLALGFFSCEPIVERDELKNVTGVDGVQLEAVQSTTGGNEITLNMTTPGVTGYWDYNLGIALTNKLTIIYPIPGTATFTFTGTLGAEFFTKTIDAQIDQLDHALDQDWYDLVSENTSTGKTWVFDGVGGDDRLWWFMSPPSDPDSWASVWWNAGGTCCPPPDVDGKIVFDLDGAANYHYYSGPGATPVTGSFVLDVENQTLQINGAQMLGQIEGGGGDIGNADGLYQIIELTEEKLVLYTPMNSWSTGWTFVFKPAE